MTKQRYHLPILTTVIGLVVSGCGVFGGNSDDYTISVMVSGPSASERALGIASAIAPLAEGETAPALRHITPAVERTTAGGVSVTVTAAPVGPDFEFLDSTPLDDVCSRARLRGSETGSREHITLYTNIENPSPARPFGSVYALDEDNALTVDFATHSMRVRSSEFPPPPPPSTSIGYTRPRKNFPSQALFMAWRAPMNVRCRPAWSALPATA